MPNKRQFRTDAKRGLYRIRKPDTGILVFECHFFASFANCVIRKITSPSEKTNCVGWYFESKSIVKVQRNFHTKFNKPPPSRNGILSWHKKFLETGSVLDKPRSGRPSTSDTDVERIREAFTRSPTKSTRQASIELGVARSSIRDVLHKRLHFKPYKMQLVQQLKPSDLSIRFNFAVEMLHRIDVDNDFLQLIIFTDEATFRVSGHVNKHNTRIWGSENPHFIIETVHDSPKVNVWCGLISDRVIGPFIFAESTVTKEVYLDMLQLFAIPQISHVPNIFWQQYGTQPHWGKIVRSYLDTQFPQRWIGRDGPLA
ncbi:hypothetical protein AVEN_250250-1 [Araneus ventricosus]|uniref:DUF4817 domain-containing protein n=1 Tax=Araneus ventricosus TaxID=182803 RepID=A0A4Y2FEW0_ARAVE|nr:hypothetical protein AVEN_250250-1 [Araneus ventricosus]